MVTVSDWQTRATDGVETRDAGRQLERSPVGCPPGPVRADYVVAGACPFAGAAAILPVKQVR